MPHITSTPFSTDPEPNPSVPQPVSSPTNPIKSIFPALRPSSIQGTSTTALCKRRTKRIITTLSNPPTPHALARSLRLRPSEVSTQTHDGHTPSVRCLSRTRPHTTIKHGPPCTSTQPRSAISSTPGVPAVKCTGHGHYQLDKTRAEGIGAR